VTPAPRNWASDTNIVTQTVLSSIMSSRFQRRTKPEALNVVLVQFDLEGHSGWARETARKNLFAAAERRRRFEDQVCKLMDSFKFDCLHWLGDGGVFSRKFSNAKDADDAVKAIAKVFKIFETFKKKAGNESLRLRATATKLNDVVVYNDPSSWFGPELNEFLKYQRQLAGPFPFAVTRSLRA